MKIQVNCANFNHSDAVVQHVDGCISKQLKSVADQVTRVEVHLMDETSPPKHTTRDQRCTMEVRLAGRGPIAVEQRGDDMYQVIRRAAEKLERAIRHRLDRLYDDRRRPDHRMTA